MRHVCCVVDTFFSVALKQRPSMLTTRALHAASEMWTRLCVGGGGGDFNLHT